MTQSLSSWLDDPKFTPGRRIDGEELLRRTANKIAQEDTLSKVGDGASGALTVLWGVGGCLIAGGWIGALLLLLFLFAEGNLDTACLTVGILAAVAFVVFYFLKPNRGVEAREIYVDSSPATLEEIKRIGARDALPSEIEKLREHVVRIIQQGAGYMMGPENWMIDSNPGISSFTVGNTIFLKREAFNSRFIGALVAYELARLNNGDGRIKIALKRLEIPQFELPFADEWREYWRQQVFAADEFVVKIGYAKEMMAYLEYYRPAEIAREFLSQEEPYIDERIYRLKSAQT